MTSDPGHGLQVFGLVEPHLALLRRGAELGIRIAFGKITLGIWKAIPALRLEEQTCVDDTACE